MNFIRWFTTPNTPSTNKRNFLNVQIDAIGVGIYGASAPFLPVFLTHLGATNFQVGLLTSMPAVTGFLLAIVLGNFLQRKRNVVPWFSWARLLVVTAYALTGLVTLIVPVRYAVPAVLAIWALATLPQTMSAIAFSVVMNAVAGPRGRFELMSRRWSVYGFTMAVTVIIVGQILDIIDFPLNYQIVFIGLSLGGLISFYYSNSLKIPDVIPDPPKVGLSILQRVRDYAGLIKQEKDFISFTSKRFVYLFGSTLALPLFPLYYVREVQASDGWIGIISTVQTAVLIIGYFFWTNQSRAKGSRRVLLLTTFAVSFYPALISLTHNLPLIALIAGLAGIFLAGIDLVFFDELMKTVPVKYSATFVSFAQSLQYLSAIVAPILGTILADGIGLSGALMVSAAIRMIGFVLFATGKPGKVLEEEAISA